jgi:hypothetical protein
MEAYKMNTGKKCIRILAPLLRCARPGKIPGNE